MVRQLHSTLRTDKLTSYMKKLFFISFCLLLLSTTVFSQTIQELETKLKHTKDPDTLLKTYTDIGTKHYNDGNFTTALDYYLKVLDATKNTKSLLNTAIATHGAGSVYLETENYEKAETYLKEAQQLFSQLNDNRSLGRVLITLGNVYYMQMQDSLSEVYYLQGGSHGFFCRSRTTQSICFLLSSGCVGSGDVSFCLNFTGDRA